jgi:hypothetical protein
MEVSGQLHAPAALLPVPFGQKAECDPAPSITMTKLHIFISNLRFSVVAKNTTMSRVVTPYSSVDVQLRFAGRYRVHLHSQRIIQARNYEETGGKQKLIRSMKIDSFSETSVSFYRITEHDSSSDNSLHYACKLI